MRFRTRPMVVITVVAFVALAGTAYALSVDPSGGPVGSRYQVRVDCATPATIRVFPLKAYPQATVPPEDGTESSPGTWVFDRQAGNVDELVVSDCGGQTEQFRYDVDAPALFPGPTIAAAGVLRPDRPITQVIGTDCPDGTTASVTITGPEGFTATQTAPIDHYGNWAVPIPADAPTGELTANASCGSLHFDAITIHHSGSTPAGGTEPGVTTSSEPSPSAATPSAATPVAATPSYTG